MIGIDEAGRGSLVGGVFACAVHFEGNLEFEVKDSKLISSKKRLEIYNKALSSPLIKFAIGVANLEEIENLNILNATMIAMERAFNALQINAPIKIDGNQKPKNLPLAECIIGGDKIIPQISLASIIAKVERDNAMEELHKLIPEYQINKHKGYGTKAHFEAIEKFGLSAYHRKGWNISRS